MKTSIAFIVLSLCLSWQALAQIRNHIPFQGRVSVDGENFTGTGHFKFAIYEAPNNFRPAEASIIVAPSGAIADITVTDGGAGYSNGVAITISPRLGQGSGATASATVVNGSITEITVTNPGSGYGTSGFALPRLEINDPLVRTLWTHLGIPSDTEVDFSNPIFSMPLPVVNGLYVVGLGDTSIQGMGAGALPSTIVPTQGGKIFLRVWFSDQQNTSQLLSPDTEIQAVPFALDAQRAESARTAISAQTALNAIRAQNADEARIADSVISGGVNELAPSNGNSTVAATVSSTGTLQSYGNLVVDAGPDSNFVEGIEIDSATDWWLYTSDQGDGSATFSIGTQGTEGGILRALTFNPDRTASFSREVAFQRGMRSDSYDLQTPVRKTLNIPMNSFLPSNPVIPFRRLTRAVYLFETNNSSGTFYKNLLLPEGAIISEIGVRYRDSATFAAYSFMSIDLLMSPTTTSIPTSTTIASASLENPTTTPEASDSLRVLSDNSIATPTVDNDRNIYTIRVFWRTIQSIATDRLNVDSVYVNYTINSLNP